ncbi:MAG TPA: hypothetical protein VNN18_04405 [Candidatus Xenobia bacterium]|nr:hypothetical protein [Candidatus Xenobia bacterium]
MTRRVLALMGALLLAMAIWAAYPSGTKAAGLRCTLTGQKIDSCCCIQKDGKLYCPLAKKTIEKCCCEPAGSAK